MSNTIQCFATFLTRLELDRYVDELADHKLLGHIDGYSVLLANDTSSLLLPEQGIYKIEIDVNEHYLHACGALLPSKPMITKWPSKAIRTELWHP